MDSGGSFWFSFPNKRYPIWTLRPSLVLWSSTNPKIPLAFLGATNVGEKPEAMSISRGSATWQKPCNSLVSEFANLAT